MDSIIRNIPYSPPIHISLCLFSLYSHAPSIYSARLPPFTHPARIRSSHISFLHAPSPLLAVLNTVQRHSTPRQRRPIFVTSTPERFTVELCKSRNRNGRYHTTMALRLVKYRVDGPLTQTQDCGCRA